MNIFKVVTGNIVKWWQLTVMPVLRIDNNRMRQNPQMVQPPNVPIMPNEGVNQSSMSSQTAQNVSNEMPVTPESTDSTSVESSQSLDGADALAVMNRINKEREEKRLRDLEKARMKAEEDARLASIMNANKVDVNSFIQAGREAIEEKRQVQEDISVDVADEIPQNVDADALAKAQEIMDRLNREAAEDEAKKQAEIDAAKQQAQDMFGV